MIYYKEDFVDNRSGSLLSDELHRVVRHPLPLHIDRGTTDGQRIHGESEPGGRTTVVP